MRQAALAATVAWLAASWNGDVGAQETMAVPRIDWGTFNFERSTGMTTGTLNGAAATIYAAIPEVFKDLGLQPKELDPTEKILGVKRHRLVRKLGKQQISRYLSCGDGLLGPNADSYYVYVTMNIQVVQANAGTSKLVMYFGAEAVNVPGGQSDRIPCATTGVFEHQAVTRLQAMFGG